MADNDDILNKLFTPSPLWVPKDKFKFSKGESVNFSDIVFYIYEETSDYVTISIRKKYATAKLMHFMDTHYDAVYIGPMIEWIDGVHLTFKRKS